MKGNYAISLRLAIALIAGAFIIGIACGEQDARHPDTLDHIGQENHHERR